MNRLHQSAWLPLIAMLSCVTLLGAGTSWAKIALFPAVGATGTSAFRVGFSALFLLTIWRPWRTTLPRDKLLPLALYGFSLGLMNLCFYLSLQTIPFGVALAIEFVGPLGVAILYSRKWTDFLWVCLAITGLSLLLPFKASHTALDTNGVIFALAAAFFWALYIVFGKRISTLHHGQTVPYGMLLAAIIVVPVGVVDAGSNLLSISLFGVAFCIAVISSALPISLEMFALKRVPAKTYGILVSMEPAVAALLAQAMLAEYLTLTQWGAIVLVMTASIGGALTSKSESLHEATT